MPVDDSKTSSAVSLQDLSISTATDQTISCLISGLSKDTPVTWIDNNDNEISDSDTSNYVVNQGNYVFGSKSATLTIKTRKLESLSSGDVFKCKVKSGFYPIDSPDVVKETVITVLTLGLLLSYSPFMDLKI